MSNFEYFEYGDYVHLYQQLVDEGKRPAACMASFSDWEALADVTKETIMCRLKRELSDYLYD